MNKFKFQSMLFAALHENIDVDSGVKQFAANDQCALWDLPDVLNRRKLIC